MIRLFLFLIIISSISCSSLRFEKKRYSKGFFVSSNLNSNKQPGLGTEQKSTKKSSNNDKINHSDKKPYSNSVNLEKSVSDTVIVSLKNGNVYKGVITEEKENGVFLQVSPDKNIFINHIEIDNIVVAKASNQNSYNLQSTKGNTKEDYYTSGRKAQKQPNKKRERKARKSLDESLPRETKKASTYFTLAVILAFIPLIDLLSIVFFLIGASYEEKGYRVAKKNPEKYDMGRIFQMHETVKVVMFILKAILIMILVATLVLLIVNSL